MSRSVIWGLVLLSSSSIVASQTDLNYRFCTVEAEVSRYFMQMRQQGISVSNALAREKARIEQHATENGADRNMLDHIWMSNQDAILRAYDHPIGATQGQKDQIITEHENRVLSDCLRATGQLSR